MPPCRHCPLPDTLSFHRSVGAGHARPATSRLPPLNLPFVGRGLDPSAAPCLYPTAYPLHLPVGAGHARPATSRLPPLNPPFVGRGLDPSAAPCLCRCFTFHSVGAAIYAARASLVKGRWPSPRGRRDSCRLAFTAVLPSLPLHLVHQLFPSRKRPRVLHRRDRNALQCRPREKCLMARHHHIRETHQNRNDLVL